MQSPLLRACSTTSPICLCRCTTGHASTGIGAATIEYGWRYGGKEFLMVAAVEGSAQMLEAGSEAEFITEHYWGCTRQRDGGTLEYEVEHPRWRVWTTPRVTFSGPAGAALRIGVRRDPQWVAAFGICRRRIAGDGVRGCRIA